MIKRLPISLKFEDTEDFYTDFIEQKKDDKELTSFIKDLLEAYYYNESIRMHIDTYIIEQNPYIQIHEQLQKITMQHKRHVNAINMLDDYNTKEVEKTHNVEDKHSNTKNDTEEKDELIRLLQKYGVNLNEDKKEVKKEQSIVNQEVPKINEFESAPTIEKEAPPVISIGEEEEKKVPKAFKKMMGSVK